jgi:hypothetical protein
MISLSTKPQKVNRWQVASAPCPFPTRTWKPIPHETLLNQVTNCLRRFGYKIEQENHTLTTDGHRYFGVLDFSRKDDDQRDYRLSVGLRNSHDKRFSAGVVAGHRVLVCSNLMFSGVISVGRKHTRFISTDLPGLVRDAISRLADLSRAQDVTIGRYKNTQVSTKQVHDLLVRSVDCGVIPGSWIPKVAQEYRHPSHDEFATSSNLWRLQNAYSEVWRDDSLHRIADRSKRLHQLFNGVPSAGLMAA